MKMILFCLALQYGDSLAYVNDTVILQSPECTPSLSDSVNAEYDSLSMESAEYRERATYHHKIKYRRMWGREKIFMLTYNLTRILSGHPPTIQSFRLNKAAREHSRWMAEKGWSCTHRDFDKRSRKYRFDSENVANGQYGSFGVLIAWIKSPRHRKNMYGYDQFLSGVGFYKRIEITYKKKGGKVKRIKKEKMKYYTHVFR